MSETTPGVIYLEVDEDITSAIDKLTRSGGSVVQVVAAKRSTLFQSVINLKLLQKASKDAGKRLVVVTNDRVVTNLAGKIGVAVAERVGEAAHVPAVTPLSSKSAEDEIDGGAIGDDPAADGIPASPLETPVAAAEPTSAAVSEDSRPTAAARRSKGPRVPNIGKMQKRLLWVGALVALIVAWFAGNYFLSSANVELYAKGSQVHASFGFTADPTAAESNISGAVLSAQQLSENKTLNTTVQATGTQDQGAKATGTMTISNCSDDQSHTLVAGTRFTSPNGLVFTSTADATVPGGKGTFFSGCTTPGTTTVSVQANANGDQYNLASGTRYTIPGLPASEQSSFYGVGGAMSGGVTKIAKVIQQSDITTAEQAALAANKTSATSDLTGKANSQQVALPASFQQNVGSATSNPAVGATADTASLSIQVNYTMLAVQKSELSKLAQDQESQQLGPQSQIYDDGSNNLQLTLNGSPQSSGAQKFKASATAYAGTKIDTQALAKQLAGQKYGDATATAAAVSGVDKATITLSPSWSSSLPHIASHIHIKIKVDNPSG